jgi:hypothetical protein
LIGGHSAPSPIAGLGLASMRDALSLRRVHTQTIDGDLLIEGDSILETQHGRGYSH